MKIALAADHAGFLYKERIKQSLEVAGFGVLDLGTNDERPVDYPDFGYAAGLAVSSGQVERAIVVCGSSIGISIAANKVPGVRCAPVADVALTELSRRHNDVNVIALSERLSTWETVAEVVAVFLATPFDGGRHAERVSKLHAFQDEVAGKAAMDLRRGYVSEAETRSGV